MVRAKVLSWSKRTVILLTVAALTSFAIRVYDVQRGPRLEIWHTYVPRELDTERIDKTDWNGYLAEEARIFEDLRHEVSRKLTPSERVPINRYFEEARSIRRTFRRISIVRLCSNRIAPPAGWSCCCTG